MSKSIEPDLLLISMPSLRAVKSFVAAGKYQNFSQAAQALCVTQAAISRQILELEEVLQVKLFHRTGRAVELTEIGHEFYDACNLSLINIAQSAQRVKQLGSVREQVNVCCSPAFLTLWLSDRLPEFIAENPHIDINLSTSNNASLSNIEEKADIYINKNSSFSDGYQAVELFYDKIFPVCSQRYLDENGLLNNVQAIKKAALLNLTPFGRSQVAEHIDWPVWFALQKCDMSAYELANCKMVNSNDYNTLLKMAANHQGVCLGWQHLVSPLLDKGVLVAIEGLTTVLKEKRHYLHYRAAGVSSSAISCFKHWILEKVKEEETSLL